METRILVVDDSPTVYEMVRRQLEPEGYIVDALTAFTALPEYLRSTPPHLILLDLEMPALSGHAFARFIRKHQPQEIPIVVHSARPEVELRRASDAMGALGYVSKSAVNGSLRRVVRRALSMGQQGQAG
ncbi:MAG: response regulator [Myxococcales bacterium]|nr:response regulator [Myxococcales bacterium]